MEEKLTEVKFTINIPFDKPNKNGTIFTKEAVENAINNFPTNTPIIYKDSKNNFNNKVIGTTTDNPVIVDWDSENQVCKTIIDGVVFHCGAEIVVNEIKDNYISSFEIRSVGVTI